MATQAEYDALSPTEQKAYDAQARAKELAEQAELPYEWIQDLQTVTVTWTLPAGVARARDLAVVMNKSTLKVRRLLRAFPTRPSR